MSKSKRMNEIKWMHDLFWISKFVQYTISIIKEMKRRIQYFHWNNPHSKNCGVKITPPVLIEDHTMHTGVKFAVLVQHPVVLF